MIDMKKEAQELSGEIIKWRRELHQIPETGLHLPKTSEYVRNKLDEWGIPYKTYEGHSGILAYIGKGGGKVAALRADMDALNVIEENDCDYRSTNGCMHACGHDAHTAGLLGVAKILKSHEDEIDGLIKLIFQPDEELLTGAPHMVADGVMDDPKVDGLFVLHCGVMTPEAPAEHGDVIICRGAAFCASGNYHAVIHGVGGHASNPQQAKDPTIAAARFIESLQSIRSREISPFEGVAINVSYMGAGAEGGAVGIIPDKAVVEGGFRSTSLETHAYLMKRIEESLNGVAASMGMTAEIKIDPGCFPVVNDPGMLSIFDKTVRKIVPEDKIVYIDHGGLAGEDAGSFFLEAPGCYFFLKNIAPSDDGKVYPHHHPRFTIDDSLTYIGTALLGQAALDLLES